MQYAACRMVVKILYRCLAGKIATNSRLHAQKTNEINCGIIYVNTKQPDVAEINLLNYIHAFKK